MSGRAIPKNPPLRDPDYLAYLRSEPCIISGLRSHSAESVVPMHIGTAGKGIKSGDDEALPIMNRYHQMGHAGGEISMLREYLPEVILRAALRAYARELYQIWKRPHG